MDFPHAFRFLRTYSIGAAVTVAAAISILLFKFTDASVVGLVIGGLLGVYVYGACHVTWDFSVTRVRMHWPAEKARLFRMAKAVAAAFGMLAAVLYWLLLNGSVLECVGLFVLVGTLSYAAVIVELLVAENLTRLVFKRPQNPLLFAVLVTTLWAAANDYTSITLLVPTSPPRITLAA